MVVVVDLFVGWYMVGWSCWLLDSGFEFGGWFQYFFCCMLSLGIAIACMVYGGAGMGFDVVVMCFADLI